MADLCSRRSLLLCICDCRCTDSEDVSAQRSGVVRVEYSRYVVEVDGNGVEYMVVLFAVKIDSCWYYIMV